MKIRTIQRKGYDNGVSLAQAWLSEGLMPSPIGEVCEVCRLVDKNSVKNLGDDIGIQGPNLSFLELWEKQAIKQENKKFLERIRAWDEKRLLSCLEELHKKILAESLDKGKYPEVQGLAAYEDEEAKGIADVFETDYRRVLLCKDNYSRLMRMRIMEEWKPEFFESGKCTTIIFKDSPVGPIIGRNMDSDIGCMAGLQSYGEPVLFQYPEEMGYSYIASAEQINSKGLVIQGSSISYPNERTYARFWLDTQGLILRFCKTVEEALDFIERYNPFLGPSNLVVLDARGDAAVIEKTKNTFAVRKTDKNWIFTTDGVAIEEKTRKIQGDNTPAYQFNLKRHKLIENLLREEKAPGVEPMQRILSNHSMPSPVCKHPEKMPVYYQAATLYSFILVPREKISYFRVIRPGPVYPCEEEPTKYSYWFT